MAFPGGRAVGFLRGVQRARRPDRGSSALRAASPPEIGIKNGFCLLRLQRRSGRPASAARVRALNGERPEPGGRAPWEPVKEELGRREVRKNRDEVRVRARAGGPDKRNGSNSSTSPGAPTGGAGSGEAIFCKSAAPHLYSQAWRVPSHARPGNLVRSGTKQPYRCACSAEDKARHFHAQNVRHRTKCRGGMNGREGRAERPPLECPALTGFTPPPP